MSSLRRTLHGGTALHRILPRSVGLIWLLVMAWVLIVAERTHHPVFASRNECGTDPVDILRAGEILEGSSLRFIVDSHCSNARFLPHGWIALSYGGIRVDVETKELEVAGATYYEVVSVGGITAP